MYVARPIEWRLEKPHQPIREAGKLKFFRTICQEHKKREKERIKHVKLKVSTLYNQIKQSGLKIFNYKVFRSGIIPETLWTTLHQSPGVVFPKK